MTGAAQVAAIVATVGCGLAGGAFLAFSTFVMAGLADLSDAQGLAAMQSINRAAITPLFMLAIFGTALLCLGLGVWALTHLGDRSATLVLIACAVYLAGAVGVTMAGNVPMNDHIATLVAGAPGAAEDWRGYLDSWTTLNHVRTIAGTVASALLVLALV